MRVPQVREANLGLLTFIYLWKLRMTIFRSKGMGKTLIGKQLRPVIPHLVHPFRNYLFKISMFFHENIAEIMLLAQQNRL